MEVPMPMQFSAQDGQQAAAAEAWCVNAAAWADRLSSSFPGYNDLTQPVALAVHEARRGFAMMAAAANIAWPLGRRGSASGAAARLEVMLRALMAFPASADAADGAAAAELATGDAQGLAARLASASTVWPYPNYRLCQSRVAICHRGPDTTQLRISASLCRSCMPALLPDHQSLIFPQSSSR